MLKSFPFGAIRRIATTSFVSKTKSMSKASVDQRKGAGVPSWGWIETWSSDETGRGLAYEKNAWWSIHMAKRNSRAILFIHEG